MNIAQNSKCDYILGSPTYQSHMYFGYSPKTIRCRSLLQLVFFRSFYSVGYCTTNGFWLSGHRTTLLPSCVSSYMWTPDNLTSVVPVGNAGWCCGDPNCTTNDEACVILKAGVGYYLTDGGCSSSFCPLCEIDQQ
jgi:hypothetical protein